MTNDSTKTLPQSTRWCGHVARGWQVTTESVEAADAGAAVDLILSAVARRTGWPLYETSIVSEKQAAEIMAMGKGALDN